MHNLLNFWGSAPDPDGGAYSAPPYPPCWAGGGLTPSRTLPLRVLPLNYLFICRTNVLYLPTPMNEYTKILCTQYAHSTLSVSTTAEWQKFYTIRYKCLLSHLVFRFQFGHIICPTGRISGDVREKLVAFRGLYHVVELQLSHMIWAVTRTIVVHSIVIWLLNGDSIYK